MPKIEDYEGTVLSLYFVAHGLMYSCPLFLTLLVVCQFESIFFMLPKDGKGNRLVPSLRRALEARKPDYAVSAHPFSFLLELDRTSG